MTREERIDIKVSRIRKYQNDIKELEAGILKLFKFKGFEEIGQSTPFVQEHEDGSVNLVDDDGNELELSDACFSMEDLIANGIDTFVSLEPVVDFESTLKVIKTFIYEYNYCPPEFRIGLMSGIDKKKHYNWQDCDAFIKEVKSMAIKYDFTVKWKNSIVSFYNEGLREK